MKLFRHDQFAGGPFGWFLALLIVYVIVTVSDWRIREDIDVQKFHFVEHQSLIQYVESQGRYVLEATKEIWR